MLSVMLLCSCSTSSDPIVDIDHSSCKENFGQVQKYIFRKVGQPDIVVSTDDPKLKATWTALLSAVDDSKVQVTPFISKPEFGGGEVEEFGSGNDVLGGIPLVQGSKPTTVSGVLYDAPQKSVVSLKKYMCPSLEVFMINERGQMACSSDNPDVPTVIRGFPIRSLFIGDKKIGGFNAPDTNIFSFSMEQDWSNGFTIITPTDFNFKDLQ